MRTLRIDKIIIKDNRQRQEFEPEAMQALKNSIEDIGLMHPIVIRQEGEDWVLVAGERRLTAVKEIFDLGGKFYCDGEEVATDCIPFVTLGELSVLEAEEAELDENLKRRDLTWQEHAAAVSRLHTLRQAQHSKVVTMSSESDPDDETLNKIFTDGSTHSIADTAEELTGRRDGSYQDTVRREIIVARHLTNPIIAKAKSADEAYKLLKRQEEQTRNIALAAHVGKSFNSSLHELHNVDCLKWMQLPGNQQRFDVILTDPPYGMDAQAFGDGAGRLDGIEHHYDDSYASWKDLMEEWAVRAFAVTKPQAHAYVFCDIDRFHELKAFMQAAGWYVFRTPLINHKVNSGRVPLPDMGPRRQYELILYAIKGKKSVTHIYPDVLSTTADENMTHGAQKPVAVFQNLLQRSVRPGDTVLDCFAGTGPVFPAAHTFQCAAVGLELNQEYFAISMKRLQALKQADNEVVI